MSKAIKVPNGCTGCTACASVCAKHAIRMLPNKEGFLYPFIESEKCVDCGACKNVCPILHKNSSSSTSETDIFSAIHRDREIRRNSSSGGAFTAIGKFILDRNGVVYGAAMTDDFKTVKHIKIDNMECFEKIRGSKYVQSEMTGVFKDIKGMLHKGRLVLFSGTPCQVAGLKAYLNQEYDNLYTLDVVCHGVPSPLVWEKYILKEKENKDANLKKVNFRDKITGWKKYSLSFAYDDGNIESRMVIDDVYLKGFVHSMTIRRSCFACKFRNIHRCSDFTLADCWGADEYLKDADDDFGISAVLIHSDKGRKLFQQLEDLSFNRIGLNDFIRYNPSLTDNESWNDNRKYFFKRLVTENIDINQLLMDCDSRRTLLGRIRNKLYRMRNAKQWRRK